MNCDKKKLERNINKLFITKLPFIWNHFFIQKSFLMSNFSNYIELNAGFFQIWKLDKNTFLQKKSPCW